MTDAEIERRLSKIIGDLWALIHEIRGTAEKQKESFRILKEEEEA